MSDIMEQISRGASGLGQRYAKYLLGQRERSEQEQEAQRLQRAQELTTTILQTNLKRGGRPMSQRELAKFLEQEEGWTPELVLGWIEKGLVDAYQPPDFKLGQEEAAEPPKTVGGPGGSKHAWQQDPETGQWGLQQVLKPGYAPPKPEDPEVQAKQLDDIAVSLDSMIERMYEEVGFQRGRHENRRWMRDIHREDRDSQVAWAKQQYPTIDALLEVMRELRPDLVEQYEHLLKAYQSGQRPAAGGSADSVPTQSSGRFSKAWEQPQGESAEPAPQSKRRGSASYGASSSTLSYSRRLATREFDFSSTKKTLGGE